MQDLLRSFSKNYAEAEKTAPASLPWENSPWPDGFIVKFELELNVKKRNVGRTEMFRSKLHLKRRAIESASGLAN